MKSVGIAALISLHTLSPFQKSFGPLQSELSVMCVHAEVNEPTQQSVVAPEIFFFFVGGIEGAKYLSEGAKIQKFA